MDRTRKFFDAIATRYDRAYGLPRDESRARMARVLRELPPAARVLDLGVGTGRELTALLDAGHAPTGLDFASNMLAICMRRARPVPLVLASFWDPLPFPDGAFDAAIALHGTLAHPPDDGALSRLVGELARVLTPDGIFLAEVPSPAWLDTLASSSAPDRSVRRIDASRCVYEDTVADVSIEARFLGPAEWTACLTPRFAVTVEPMTRAELLVVARRSPAGALGS